MLGIGSVVPAMLGTGTRDHQREAQKVRSVAGGRVRASA